MLNKPKIAYITCNSPYGNGETFITTELLELQKYSWLELIVIPRDRTRQLFHDKAAPLTKNVLAVPWFSAPIALVFIKALFCNSPIIAAFFLELILGARNFRIALQNIAVLPKAVYLSRRLKEESASHVHAHWGTTPSTMAYIISKMTNIPWSVSLHRGDIKDNNLLKLKVRSAEFTRCISEDGKRMVLDIVGSEFGHKLVVIPMGVEVRSRPGKRLRNKPVVIAVPANLYNVKGHRYLIEACSLLRNRGSLNIRCLLYGQGYLRNQLISQIKSAGLTESILLPGTIQNEELIELYRTGSIDIVVLPSIMTEDGEHEGIPVSLIEAMGCGLPVISTRTGGIPELIGDGSGMMIEEKDAEALANAIYILVNETELYESLAEKGWHKVRSSFSVSTSVRQLLKLYLPYADQHYVKQNNHSPMSEPVLTT